MNSKGGYFVVEINLCILDISNILSIKMAYFHSLATDHTAEIPKLKVCDNEIPKLKV
jgi:hypoxanthine phosphoribosyltransferase